jgi:hypothetical protein
VRSALAKVSLEPVIFLAFSCSGMIGKEAKVKGKMSNYEIRHHLIAQSS